MTAESAQRRPWGWCHCMDTMAVDDGRLTFKRLSAFASCGLT